MKKLFFILFLLSSSAVSFSQTGDDVKLAMQYMQNGEYDKARDIYEKLYQDNSNLTNYKYLYNCLLTMQEYDDVEKLVRKQIKKIPDNLNLYVDLGNSYKKQNNEEKKTGVFNTAISKIGDNRNQVVQLANAFLGIDETEFAIAAYKRGKEIVEGSTFNQELANLYYRTGNVKLSMQTYLDYLTEPDVNMQTLYNALQRMLD
ncbi:MAG: hypothetical protein H7Y00_14465, partial [Fimbriimonadaceae bacterium]|nr:hypothetical protein [Chitinophagales bacterium]